MTAARLLWHISTRWAEAVSWLFFKISYSQSHCISTLVTNSQSKSGLWMSHCIWLYFDLKFFIWVLAVMIRSCGPVGRWVTPVSSLLQAVFFYFSQECSLFISSCLHQLFPASLSLLKKNISRAWCCHHNLSLNRWRISFPHIYIILQTKTVFVSHPTRGNVFNRRCTTLLRFLLVRIW